MPHAPGDLALAGFHCVFTVTVMGLIGWRLHHHQPLGWGLKVAETGVAVLSLLRYHQLRSRQRRMRLQEPLL